MTEGKRGPGRPKKVQPVGGEQAASTAVEDGAIEESAPEIGRATPPAKANDEIIVKVIKHFEQRGVTVPVGTEFATRDTREIRRHLKHRCLEQVG